MFWFSFLRTSALFSISNSIVFVDRGRKNISYPRAQAALATPLFVLYFFLKIYGLFTVRYPMQNITAL